MFEQVVLASAVISAVCLVILVGSLRQAVRRLDELTRTLHQFRGSLNEIIGSQRDAIQASRDQKEEEAAKRLMEQDRPA
jgi:uncharacterized protein (DUF3084 family)